MVIFWCSCKICISVLRFQRNGPSGFYHILRLKPSLFKSYLSQAVIHHGPELISRVFRSRMQKSQSSNKDRVELHSCCHLHVQNANESEKEKSKQWHCKFLITITIELGVWQSNVRQLLFMHLVKTCFNVYHAFKFSETLLMFLKQTKIAYSC